MFERSRPCRTRFRRAVQRRAIIRAFSIWRHTVIYTGAICFIFVGRKRIFIPDDGLSAVAAPAAGPEISRLVTSSKRTARARVQTNLNSDNRVR